jgi:hypothetical protein
MSLVLRIPGVTIKNPNLPTLVGIDIDRPIGSVFFDFGSALSTDSEWNNVDKSDTQNFLSRYELSSVLSSAGLKTGIRVSSERKLRFSSTDVSGVVGYPDSVVVDAVYVGGLSNNPVIDSCEIYIDGLSKKKLYSLEIFAGRAATTGGSRVGYYTANGRTGILDAKNNTDQLLVLENVAADQSGRITLLIDRRDSEYAYLNSLKIIEI